MRPGAVTSTDYHTAGEPFRIVTAGVPEIAGDTVLERRDTAASSEELDAIRRLLCHEPRGHADMYGCFVTPPDDAEADFGAVFWHKDGYSTACGHGTIALGAWAVRSGRVQAPEDGEHEVVIDVPSGRVRARVGTAGGRVTTVAFANVPSFVAARDVPAAGTPVDVAFGGAYYAFVPAERLGLTVDPGALPDLIDAAREIRYALADAAAVRHAESRLAGVYGVVIHERVAGQTERNVTVFADGAVDRSPCGSATSARTALLLDAGEVEVGEWWTNTSIIGTTFEARALEPTVDGVPTEVAGAAFPTGEHRFDLDPQDPLGTGFVLR
ncbi:MAG: proline racemase family protein [Actinobacteria bacterium]|nr:proline racemase family protein [Actinomycetota bacterium]